MTEHEYDDSLAEDEVFEFVEIYEDEPDFDAPQADEDGLQEDEGLGGNDPRVPDAPRSWQETLVWYRTHQNKAQIGFDPDNMCLKVCRTARGIPPRYLSAKEAQDATPKEFRIYDVEDLRRSVIGFFDDPNDSNRFGHIATMIGRVKGFNPKSLHDTLWETNSVKANELVVVRGDYFERYWGDKFKFGATWLNGYELDVPGHTSRVERFNNGGPVYNLNLLAKAAKAGRPKPGEILRRIEDQVRRLPDNRNVNNVREFKDEWRETRKIDMSLLDEAVKNGRVGLVKRVRDEIRRLIAALPEE
jgi:hypothetical protein